MKDDEIEDIMSFVTEQIPEPSSEQQIFLDDLEDILEQNTIHGPKTLLLLLSKSSRYQYYSSKYQDLIKIVNNAFSKFNKQREIIAEQLKVNEPVRKSFIFNEEIKDAESDEDEDESYEYDYETESLGSSDDDTKNDEKQKNDSAISKEEEEDEDQDSSDEESSD